MQTVKLNLIPGSVLPVVNVSQYDEKRQFALQVYEGATAYSLSGKDVQIRGTKPDGNGFAYDATDGVVSVSGNTVTISTTQQMTAVGGQTMAELRITSGDTILGTLNFVLMVEPSALSDDTPISETDIPAIERDFEAALAEAEADALVAEGYAKGTQGGVPVGSESPYYNNNAEHFKDEAEEAASDVLGKYPKIVNDYWYVWDIDQNQYVNTGVRAKGTQGDPGDPGEGVPTGGTTGQVLRKKSDDDYDTEWSNGGGGASALDDLTDVSIATPAEGDLLQYNSTSGKWENSDEIPNAVSAIRDAGAVNKFKNTASSAVKNSISYTVNADLSVYADGTVGTVFANADLTLGTMECTAGDKLILSGAPNNEKCFISFYYKADYTVQNIAISDGQELEFTVAQSGTYELYIRVATQGTTVNHELFKPMIYDARFGTDVPYQPHAMTNRELTEIKESVIVTNKFFAEKSGNQKFLNIWGATAADVKSATLPTDFKSNNARDIFFSGYARNGLIYYPAVIVYSASQNKIAEIRYSATYGAARTDVPDSYEVFGSLSYL